MIDNDTGLMSIDFCNKFPVRLCFGEQEKKRKKYIMQLKTNEAKPVPLRDLLAIFLNYGNKSLI